MGWKIFSHSVFLLNYNLRDALRISSPLILAMVLNFVLGGATAIDNLEAGTSSNFGLGILLQILSAIAGLWVAVAWHRFVLLEEMGSGLPTFHCNRMFAYFLVIVGMTLALVLAGGFLGAIAGLLLSSATPLFIVAIIAIAIFAMWFFYRLSPLLPAAALGQALGVRQAWDATAGISSSILGVVVFYIVFSLLSVAAAALIMFQVSILIGVVLVAVLQWAYTMVGISILTTIYGITIEGRDI